MVMSELAKPRDTFVLARGDYRNQTEKVQPGVPAMLPPLPKEVAPPHRLALAKWLVDPAHPLTARVAVNRFWQMYFGTGIVKTQEDFGVQGEPPVHPGAARLAGDRVHPHRLGHARDAAADRHLGDLSAVVEGDSPRCSRKIPRTGCWRARRVMRLPAEMIRDTALAVSGLLNGEIGGPSVFPYQPSGLWEEMAFGEGFSAQAYEQSHGKDLYRRGMYTFWKRTVPPASMATFDAPDREKCTARRALTNTPLQALVLMNDPTYVEAARALAQRVLLEGPRTTAARWISPSASPPRGMPTDKERGVLRALLAKQLATFGRDRQAAVKLVSVGESARDPRVDPANSRPGRWSPARS